MSKPAEHQTPEDLQGTHSLYETTMQISEVVDRLGYSRHFNTPAGSQVLGLTHDPRPSWERAGQSSGQQQTIHDPRPSWERR